MTEEKSNLVQIIKKELVAHVINLDEDIKEPEHYREAFQTLREADAGDEIVINVNSCGGSLSTVCQFYADIISSRARVHANITEAYSAAALICLSCDNIASMDHSVMMLHTATGGVWDRPKEMKDYSEFLDKRMERLIRMLCAGFLTKKEIVDLLNGKTFWFNHDEILRRTKRWTPISIRKSREEKNYGP